MGLVQITAGVLLLLFSLEGYSASQEYYSVEDIKNKKKLNLQAWPSKKSKVISHLAPQTNNIVFLNKHKVVTKGRMKSRWNKQEGSANSHFLKKRIPKNSESYKSIIKSDVIPKKKQQDDHYIKSEDPSVYSHIETRLGHAFAVQPQVKSRLSCRGLKPAKWKMNMNMGKKRMWLKIEDKKSYSLPITYSQWSRTSRKRMIVIAEKGKKRVKAKLNSSHLCRRKFSRSRYTYSINATVSHSQLLSGCCADISR